MMGFGRATAVVLALYFGLSEACLSDIGSLLALFPTPAPQMAAIRNDLCSGANDSFLIRHHGSNKVIEAQEKFTCLPKTGTNNTHRFNFDEDCTRDYHVQLNTRTEAELQLWYCYRSEIRNKAYPGRVLHYHYEDFRENGYGLVSLQDEAYDDARQQFIISRDGRYITSAIEGHRLELQMGHTFNGAPVGCNVPTNSPSQMWDIEVIQAMPRLGSIWSPGRGGFEMGSPEYQFLRGSLWWLESKGAEEIPPGTMQRYLSESERASTGVMDGFLDWNNVFSSEGDPTGSGYLDSVGRIFLEMAKLAFRQGSLFGSSTDDVAVFQMFLEMADLLTGTFRPTEGASITAMPEQEAVTDFWDELITSLRRTPTRTVDTRSIPAVQVPALPDAETFSVGSVVTQGSVSLGEIKGVFNLVPLTINIGCCPGCCPGVAAGIGL